VVEKIRLVDETLQPGISVSFVARKHGLSPSLLLNWRRRMAEGGREAVRVDDDVIGAARVRRRVSTRSAFFTRSTGTPLGLLTRQSLRLPIRCGRPRAGRSAPQTRRARSFSSESGP
jgi:transposase